MNQNDSQDQNTARTGSGCRKASAAAVKSKRKSTAKSTAKSARQAARQSPAEKAGYKPKALLSDKAKEYFKNGDCAEESSAVGICPFFKQEKCNGRLHCEGGHILFPDKMARREFVYRFCAHPAGYLDCPLRVMLENYYERKYQDHE